jgi:hypothetical protein
MKATWKKVKIEQDGDDPEHYDILDNDILIAQVHHSGMEWKEFEANTQLIAAAPDLLEAAKQVIWKLSHNHWTEDYRGPARITREDATVKMLIDAINRVEGRE